MNVNSLINKLNFVGNLLGEEKLTLLAVCETWLVESVSTSFVDIVGYDFFRCDVVGQIRKHGVGLYVKRGLDVVRVEVEVPNVLVVHAQKWNIYILVVYRPPSYSDVLNECLSRFIVSFCLDKNIIMLGDFNLPSLRWDVTGELVSGYISPRDRSFFEAFQEAGLTQIVHEQTLITSGNTLDLILVSNTEMIGDLHIAAPLPRCYHCPVLVDVYIPLLPVESQNRWGRLWHKGNFGAISREVHGICWEVLFEGLTVDECYNLFMEKYFELIELYVPLKQYTETSRWNSRPPRSLVRRRKTAWDKFLYTRRIAGRRHQLTCDAWVEYSIVNSEFRSFSIRSQAEYELKIVNALGENPKLFHSYLRRKKKGAPPIGPLKQNGCVISGPLEMSKVLVQYFGSVFNSQIPNYVEPHLQATAAMDPLIITLNDVLIVLSGLDTSSAAGRDEVHPLFLKSCAEAVCFPLLLIFVKSLRSGILPVEWRHSLVVPIFKSGSRCSPLNYRPISLTSVCCKTMERIIAGHIESYLEANGFIEQGQFGFRRGRSTEDQLLLVYCEVARLVDLGCVVDMVFLDFSKAFDLVSHQMLLEKLLALRFDPYIVGWIRDFLVRHSMSVIVSGQTSSEVIVTSGVPQGSVLGPLLFLIYVNCITKDVGSPWVAFADDFKVSISFPRRDADVGRNRMDQLQSDLDTIARVSGSWNLRLNPEKCVGMRFGSFDMATQPHYTITGVPLTFHVKYKDLGVIVDPKLRFHDHVDFVVGRTSSMINNLLRSTVCRSSFFMTTLWVSHVRPLVEFNSCVWNVGYLCDTKRLESLQ